MPNVKDLKSTELLNSFVQLARIALTGRSQDVQLLVHRASKKFKVEYPEMSDELISLLKESPTRATPLRKNSETPLPVDIDSRLQLLKIENSHLDHAPIFNTKIESSISQVITERRKTKALFKHGLLPTKSLLFSGPPGVGKTMAAKWIANELNLPLLILDLTAVMSSFLGRTGNNIRFVLDYAKNTDCILLLDEVDAIAKKRDDNSEIGELKRLVNVLLQEIDDWPSTGLLIAATNHPDLLDPAIWRRFEMIVEFENPSSIQAAMLIQELITNQVEDANKWAKILSIFFKGKSFSEIERLITIARRSSAIKEIELEEELKKILLTENTLPHSQKVELACELVENKILSQRQASELTGISRDTIRKNLTA
ncbi:AAA family ATPase [Chryseobacterium bernardetii]|uniref:AAA family ATPase n=1 Tax=Chryseobacterium bernardetii TaxID=1241978 RepID=UPI003AF791A7